jgi:hypothetical protein
MAVCRLACLALLCTALPCRADPLRLVPGQADLVVKIEQPRQLLDSFLSLDAFRQVQGLQPVRELYDSTNARRFYQLLGYFEKKLGTGRFDLLDRLAGGGVVLAVKVAPAPAPVLLVVQARDEKLLHDFVQLAGKVIDQELARLESKERLEKYTYRGVDGVQAGKKLYLAAAGSALLVSNREGLFKLAIDLHASVGKSIKDNAGLVEARRLLPSQPLIWVWLNLPAIRELPQVKEAIPAIELNPVTAPFVSSWLDAAKRAPFLCASLGRDGHGFMATVRLPRGLEGMSEAGAVYLPPQNDVSPPLLEPRDVQVSSSYYLDLGRLWQKRDQVLSKEARKGLESFEKNSGRFLGGIKLGKLLSQAGAHQRFVQVNPPPPSTVYKVRPKQPVGAFAVVQEMRDPAFARSMNTILRTVAILGAAQFNLKMVEEKYAGCALVSYRFPEKGKYPGDLTGVRFGFSPSFVQVGDQFVVSSTVELARELVDALHREHRGKNAGASSVHTRVYASGVAAQLRAAQDQLVTQLVLGQALSPTEANEQVRALFHLVAGLGNLDIDSRYSRNSHRLDLHFSLGKMTGAASARRD